MLPRAAVEAFRSKLEQPASATTEEALAALEQLSRSAREAWPTITLDEARFCGFVGERAGSQPLASLCARDLYLACACLDGDAQALRAFEALLDQVARKLRRLASDEDVVADAKQNVRRVLLPRGERPPALVDYRGRGELGGWLRIILGRELVRVGKRERRDPRLDTGEAALIVDGEDDPETAYLKTHYAQEFKRAFAAAIGELEDDDRRTLRYAIVERLSIDEIARLESVHRATAARDVARARERLADATHRHLRERLQLAPEQMTSILRLMSSQIDVSVRRLLAR